MAVRSGSGESGGGDFTLLRPTSTNATITPMTRIAIGTMTMTPATNNTTAATAKSKAMPIATTTLRRFRCCSVVETVSSRGTSAVGRSPNATMSASHAVDLGFHVGHRGSRLTDGGRMDRNRTRRREAPVQELSHACFGVGPDAFGHRQLDGELL